MTKAKQLIFILALFLLSDITYSFFEYYYIPLDGDISAGVLPLPVVQKVLDDPFGFHVLSTGEAHINPNRFFSHFAFLEYMQKAPLLLQKFTNPITSVYLSCAIIKIIIHLLFLFILSALISKTKEIRDKKFLIAAAIIVPLIQSNGYWGHMGIIDRATTYTFFYALPLILLMLFLMPVYRIVFDHETTKISFSKLILLYTLSIILPLSGPLIPGVVLITTGLIGIHYLLKSHQKGNDFSLKNLISAFRIIPRQLYLILVPICLVSFYSLYLGRFDSNGADLNIPLAERYLKLPLGIYYQITQSLGVPLLLIIIGINTYLIKKQVCSPEGQKLIVSLKWIGLFSAVYLLLLPFGGYRPYRPNILRYDTFIPITIALLYYYGKSTFFILENLKLPKRTIYLGGLVIFFAIYINSDQLETKEYRCEKACLEVLANTNDEVTIFPDSCNVMSWEPITDSKLSETNALLFKFWGITQEERLYYQTSEKK